MAVRSVSSHLALLVVMTVVPPLAIAVGLLLWTAVLSRDAVQAALVDSVAAISGAVEREVTILTSALYELAASPTFACSPPVDFRLQARAAAARHGGWMVLSGPDGKLRMSTHPGAGAARPTRSGVSDLFTDASGTRTVLVAVAVTDANNAFCWLGIGLPAERFSRLLEPHDRRGTWTGVLADGSDTVIAASRGAARTGSAWQPPQGTRVVYRLVGGNRWTVAVVAPNAELQSAWLIPLAAAAAVVLAILAFSLLTAGACARRMKREIANLTQLAAKVGEDGPVPTPAPSHIREVGVLAQTLVRAKQAIRERAIEHEKRTQAEAKTAAAESVNRSKDVFLATLSHELRSSLTAVIGWLEAGRAHLDDPPTVRKALDIALRNANQQARIMDDLLDVSRIVSGKFSVERHPVDLGRLAREAAEAVRLTADARRIELRAEVQEPLFIEGDRERMLQVLSNLLGNALKFTRAGGWVELRLERRGRLARLVVSDNGVGIEAQAMPHIFERFWQAEPPAPMRRRGLGLGLPVVHYIVELHGGRVFAESAGPGKGARFTVELPALAGCDPAVLVRAVRAAVERREA